VQATDEETSISVLRAQYHELSHAYTALVAHITALVEDLLLWTSVSTQLLEPTTHARSCSNPRHAHAAARTHDTVT
jgi:hypothetical protein